MAVLSFIGLALSSCNPTNIKPFNGVLDSVFKSEAPENVNRIVSEFGFDEQFEKLLDEEKDLVGVYSIFGFADSTSSEGYGIMIHKDGVWSAFPQICHGKNPLARYDAKSNSLWLTGGVMEGTGVLVEKLYHIQFHDDGKAYLAGDIDPYLMQDALCKKFGYSIKDDIITFYARERQLCSCENKEKNMGGIDEDAIWIGEQLFYDISGDDLYVYFVPGLKFVTGLVLSYEDMPTLMTKITIDKDGRFTLSDEISVLWPGEGSSVRNTR